jgi:hypothetical protein
VTTQDFGSIGKMVGGVATLATLLYLALQIRQNSKLNSASLAGVHREASTDITALLASDREALRVYWEGGKNRALLDGLDLQQFDAIVTMWFQAMAQAFAQGNDAGLAEIEYTFRFFPGYREWRTIHGAMFGEEEFRACVEQKIEVAAQEETSADSA